MEWLYLPDPLAWFSFAIGAWSRMNMNSEKFNRGMQTMSPASQKQLSQEIGEVVLEQRE